MNKSSHDDRKVKIYVFYEEGGFLPADVMGGAIGEDGKYIAQHLCSCEGYVRHDMGVNSDWKHDTYKEVYPNGYELVYIGHITNLPKEVVERNKALTSPDDGS